MRYKEKWFSKTCEKAIDPDLPICDAHHHLWDFRGRGPVGWQDRYLLEDILEDTNTGHDIQSTVFVECMAMLRFDGPKEMKPVGETEFVNGIAAQSASGLYSKSKIAAAIVGFADLSLGESVRPVLEAHITAGGSRFRGVRVAAGWDSSPEIANSHRNPKQNLYLSTEFRRGFAQLAPLGLSFDAWLFHPQLEDITDLARSFSETDIVVNHCGGPIGAGPYKTNQNEAIEQWRSGLRKLATCPNVKMKLGGLLMDLNGFDWQSADHAPSSLQLLEATKDYYEYVIELFGTNRCMFESNFPVDKVGCSYSVLWNLFKRLTKNYSANEKADLFHDVATRFYKI